MERRIRINKYIYTDYNTTHVVFECICCNISEADSLYEQKTGADPSKQNFVGCQISNVSFWKGIISRLRNIGSHK